MIRAIRPAAMAQDDAGMVVGWNVAPNIAYVLRLLPGSASCGVLLYDEGGSTLIATGAALAGTGQPCVLIPQAGQAVGMVDADLGWHLLLTTTGTESQRTIRLGPAVDLPDEIHPVYGDDALALVRATAAIDAAAHYIDDVTVTCPLGLGAGLGDVVSVPVDGVEVVGQVESITWTATPDGTTETAVIRRHVAIAPESFVEITPPTVADDTGTATHATGTSGNVLTNDEAGLTVTAVNGLMANVGVAVDGDNGGTFTINANGSWTFAPDGDFALLGGSETADTSVTYHASDGTAEAMATLTVTVSHANAAPVAVDDTGETDAATVTSGNVLTNDTDADADSLTVSKVAGSTSNVGVAVAGSNGGLFTIASNGAWTFDPNSDFDSLTGEQTATTSVTYHVSDGVAEDEGVLTVTVTAAAALWTPSEITTAQWFDAADLSTITLNGSTVSQWRDKSGNNRHAAQSTPAAQPIFTASGLNGLSVITLDGARNMIHGYSRASGYAASVFVVASIAAGVTGFRGIFSTGPTNAIGFMMLARGTTDKWGTYSTVWQPAASSLLGAGPKILEMISATDDTGSFYINGISDGTYGSSFGQAGKAIGGEIGQQITGYIAEIVYCESAINATDRQKVEGYLAHKWGLAASLPSAHPYKSAPPTI